MKKLNGVIVKIYNYLISRKWINKNHSICRKIRKILFHNICYECEASFGKLNKDRRFYLIRCPQETMGLFGVYNYVVEHLKISEAKNAEPVVDWQFYPNGAITEDSKIGKENAWEYYFERTTDISIEELYNSANVIMSSGEGLSSLAEAYNSAKLQDSARVIEKYIRLNKLMMNYVQSSYEKFSMENKKTLGLLCRGTFFLENKPKGHAVCPSVEQIIQTIYDKEKEWGSFEQIFLATEDEQIVCQLKEEFGEKIIYSQQQRISKVGNKWANELFEEDIYNDIKRTVDKEYLGSIYLLAKCHALIAPLVGGTLGAMRIKGKYEKVYLFDLGMY